MAFRPIFRKHGLLPLTATVLVAGTFVSPKTILHAEAPAETSITRKPIYDDLPPSHHSPKNVPSRPDTLDSSSPSSPTLTARLAGQIRHARLYIHKQSTTAENGLNNIMTSFLNLENSLTSTIASLAPPPATGEQLMPGLLYVLVSAMAGSIVSRNRGILLRATVPLAVGIGAGYVVLPHTMRNVGDLVWRYEEKVPVLAMNHVRLRGAAEETWRQTVVHGRLAGAWADEKVRVGREAIEDWVRKGK